MSVVWVEHQLNPEQLAANWMFLAAFDPPSNSSDVVGDGEPLCVPWAPGVQWFDRTTGRAWVAMRCG